MSLLAERFVTAFERLVECECMPEFPSGLGGTLAVGYGINAGATAGTTVTSDNNADTKGAWVELVSATPHDASMLFIDFPYNEWGGAPFLVDIGAGGSGSEVAIISDLQAYQVPSPTVVAGYKFPIFIPRGTRLSARSQDNFGGQAYIDVALRLLSGSLISCSPAGKVTTYGATANSQGTTVDPGATAHTKGAWAEIAAATAFDHHWLTLAAMNYDGLISANQRWLVDVGIGGSGSEQVLMPNIPIHATSQHDLPEPPVHEIPMFVPKGERLAVRAQCSRNTAGDRLLQVKLYGA